MPRAPDFDWYLPEWMAHSGKTQADLCRATDWPKAKMSELFNGVSRYNRDVLNTLARALNVRPFELLMPPDLAMAFRQFQASAQQIATLAHDADADDAMQGIEFSTRRTARKAQPSKEKRGTGTNG